MKLRELYPYFKAWSNFRLMVLIGSVVTLVSLGLGAVVVQAALSNGDESVTARSRAEAPAESRSQARADRQADPAQGQPAAQPPAPGANPPPPPAAGEDFRISCPAGDSNAMRNTCVVESFNGFDERVQLSCDDLPRNLSCTFVPGSVTPRRNGSTPFRIELSAGDIPPGSYDFDVVGRSGRLIRTYRYPWGLAAPRVAVAQGPVNPPPAPGAPPAPPAPPPAAAAAPTEPTFSFACGSLTEGTKVVWSLSKDGPQANIKCFLTPLNGFDEPVTFKFSQPTEVAKPDTVSFAVEQLRERKLFDLNFEFSDAVKGLPPEQLKAGRDYVFEVTGTSSSGKAMTRQVTLTVTE